VKFYDIRNKAARVI